MNDHSRAPGGLRSRLIAILGGVMALLLMHPIGLRAQQFGMSAPGMAGPMGQRDLQSPSYAIGETNDPPDASDSDDSNASDDDNNDSDQNNDSASDDNQNQNDDDQDNAQPDSDDNNMAPPPGPAN
ncbi:MAG: hypothetical protein ABSG46_05260 [Candidatus Binataceae bacterium]